MKVRFFKPLRFSSGHEVVIPYALAYFAGETVPDNMVEITEEGRAAQMVDSVLSVALWHAQKYGARDRRAGVQEVLPVCSAEQHGRGPLEGHSIRMTLDRGLVVFETHLATYDPARDAQLEGTDLEQVARDCAAMIESALIYYSRSDVILNWSGSIRSTTEV